MPELPDIALYIEAMEARLTGARFGGARIKSPFLLRTVDPPLRDLEGRAVVDLRRLGKRIAIGLDGDFWIVIHLMIAGRLHWRDALAEGKPPLPGGRNGLAAFDFSSGSLMLTEAGSKKRAGLWLCRGAAALNDQDPGGLEVLTADLAAFKAALQGRNHTLKRALTDPRIFSGIGNAYSDEILHRAGLSPVAMSRDLTDEQVGRLHTAARDALTDWTRRLRDQAAGAFPEKVTAFRLGMAVHGRYGKPCPDCGTTVQRIRHSSNETNYCPRCQTGGRLLADRSLSRLLKKDWPKSIEALEQGQGPSAGRAHKVR
ncbi:MAG: DNA-formamidopyrimidine glycosylase family protein [Pseudomonadota bacterium]